MKMDLCGDELFWDQSLTWDTDLPTFAKCFRRSIFSLAPIAIFGLFFPFYIWNLRKNTTSTSRKLSPLSVIKIILAICLCGVAIAEIVNWNLRDDEIIISLIEHVAKLVTFVLVIVLIKVCLIQKCTLHVKLIPYK